MTNDLNNQSYVTAIKNPKWMGLERFVLLNISRCWQGAHPKKAQQLCATPSSHISSMHPFIWLFLSHMIYNKPVIISKRLPWVLWVILTNYWNWEEGCWKPWIYSRVIRSRGTIGSCNWHLKWGGRRVSCKTVLNLWNLMLIPGALNWIELNWRTPI